jgi:hypothetical protein
MRNLVVYNSYNCYMSCSSFSVDSIVNYRFTLYIIVGYIRINVKHKHARKASAVKTSYDGHLIRYLKRSGL